MAGFEVCHLGGGKWPGILSSAPKTVDIRPTGGPFKRKFIFQCEEGEPTFIEGIHVDPQRGLRRSVTSPWSDIWWSFGRLHFDFQESTFGAAPFPRVFCSRCFRVDAVLG